MCLFCYLQIDSYIGHVTTLKTISRVEAGSNTPTVALRVVRGDEKGSLESEIVKYGHEPHRT
jgi:hypothetical protein